MVRELLQQVREGQIVEALAGKVFAQYLREGGVLLLVRRAEKGSGRWR